MGEGVGWWWGCLFGIVLSWLAVASHGYIGCLVCYSVGYCLLSFSSACIDCMPTRSRILSFLIL